MAVKNEYGNALFLLAKEEGSIEAVKEDLRTAELAFKENPKYTALLDTPAVSKPEKLKLIDEAFSTLHYSVVNLIKILCERHAVYSLSEVISTYADLCDSYNGIERVEAITAIPLTDLQAMAISDKLGAAIGKKIILKNTVNPEILGGVMLRYSGIQLDGSVKARLDGFAKSLKNLNL